MTPERVGLSRWQERLDPLPQGIRDAPSPVKRIVRLNRAVLDRRVGLVLHCWDSDDNKIRSSKYRQIEPIGIGSKVLRYYSHAIGGCEPAFRSSVHD